MSIVGPRGLALAGTPSCSGVAPAELWPLPRVDRNAALPLSAALGVTGVQLRRARERAGLSVPELAAAAGLSRRTIERAEADERVAPRTLGALMRILDPSTRSVADWRDGPRVLEARAPIRHRKVKAVAVVAPEVPAAPAALRGSLISGLLWAVIAENTRFSDTDPPRAWRQLTSVSPQQAPND